MRSGNMAAKYKLSAEAGTQMPNRWPKLLLFRENKLLKPLCCFSFVEMYGYVCNSPLHWHITDTGIGHADLDYVFVIPVLLFVLRLLLIRWISLRLSHVNFTPS